MKVAIGSKYQGVPFDRPCLRQMPRHWTLSTENRVPMLQGDFWVAVAIVLAGVFAIVQTVVEAI